VLPRGSYLTSAKTIFESGYVSVVTAVYRILFVCMGNICRSPTAEAVMRHMIADSGHADSYEIDSAGTGSWHAGQPPDERARDAAARHGYKLTGRARAVNDRDFVDFDLIVAVDDDNLVRLKAVAPRYGTAVIRKLTALDVPDPYYGGVDGFDNVLKQIEEACEVLRTEIDAGHTAN
jgi:protein-tyrosine phosphatase